MDWITWTVEGVGIVILCVWIAIPAREFAAIYRHMTGDRTKSVPRLAAGHHELGGRSQ